MQIRLTDIGAESGRLDSSADQCPNSYSDWEEIMVKISVLYPHKDRSAFNMNYYLNNHIPMVRQKLGAACKGMAVEQGLAGGMPGTEPTYAAMGHLLFDSVESFQAAFAPHAATIMADIPNYSAVQPVIQISEVKLS
jgi:uncharacterized protein (TIGR02118 family)